MPKSLLFVLFAAVGISTWVLWRIATPRPDEQPAMARPVPNRRPPGRPPPRRDAGSPEVDLMLCLRDVVHSDPRRALELIENGERELHRSRFSDERALLKMHALVHLGRIAAARDEAVKLLRRNPGSPLAGRVYRLTGVHPRPRPGP